MKTKIIIIAVLLSSLILRPSAFSQVPGIINFQGRIVDGGTNFNGTGQFSFALVSAGTNTAASCTATAVVTSGFVTGINVTFGGSGYTSAPPVSITGGGGSNATATAHLSGSAVGSITVNNAGSGYTSQPAVNIGAPPPGLTYTTFWSNDGSSAGGSQPTLAVPLTVTKGLYSVLLGDTTVSNMTVAISPTVFTNANVRLRAWFNDGASGFQQLSPDQRLASVGYAMNAALGAGGSSSIVSGQQLNIGLNNTLSGTLATIAGGSNNTASGLEDTVGGGAYNVANSVWATVGGGLQNTASGQATVGGGYLNTASGSSSAVGGGLQNTASGSFATVGGGNRNVASGTGAFVGGGGFDGTINGANQASGPASAVGGGIANSASGTGSFVGGGYTNTASGITSFVGGGNHNTASGPNATVVGGDQNYAGSIYFGDTVGGGVGNTASGGDSTVGGGQDNTASGFRATVPGGEDNVASGQSSFAAGLGALASNNYAFVWADGSNPSGNFGSLADDSFNVQATGGVIFYSDTNATVGVELFPNSSGWSSLSDRNMKENLIPTDPREVLDRLAAIPISTWNYKAQARSIRHLGPMAQDFHSAFGIGEDERRINNLDEEGVALAAIQGLNQKLEEQVNEKETEIRDLKRRLADLETKMQKVSDQMEQSTAAPTPAANVRNQGGM